MPTLTLDGDVVNKLYMECLFTDEDPSSDKLVVVGITGESRFSSARIEQNRQLIHELLSQLLGDFKWSGGRGASFMNFHLDDHGDPWTGNFDRNDPKEQLLQLGQAIQEVQILDLRYDWPRLPGQVPRVLIKQ